MNETIISRFLEIVEKYPKKPALASKKGSRFVSISYKELQSQVNRLAKFWQSLNLNPGEKVAILSENRPEWVITDLACQLKGLIFVPIHTTLGGAQIKFILENSQATVLVVSGEDLWQKIVPFISETKISLVVSLEPILKTTKANVEFVHFKKALLSQKVEESLKPKPEAQDIASLIYTSGTTGDPKGVELTHKNFLSNVDAALEVVPIRHKDIFLSFLPLSHVLERTAGYYGAILTGATISYAQSTKTVGEDIKLVKPTILVSVPRIFEKIYEGIQIKFKKNKLTRKLSHWAMSQKRGTFKHRLADKLVFRKIRKKMGGRLRLAISGGASLNPKISKFFAKIGLPIVEGYGLTETSPIIAVNSLEKNKFGTVGFPLDNLEVKIAPDKEILVKGPSIMKGYYNNEEATREAFDPDGWFETGDLGFFDEEGFLSIIGRKKEMIVTSYGKNVSPEKLESILNLDKYIAQAMVVGNGRKYLTALIVPDWRFLVPWTEETLNLKTRAEILADPRAKEAIRKKIDKDFRHLAKHDQIVEFTLIEEEFSQENEQLTPTLKLRREIVRHKYRKIIERMY